MKKEKTNKQKDEERKGVDICETESKDSSQS